MLKVDLSFSITHYDLKCEHYSNQQKISNLSRRKMSSEGLFDFRPDCLVRMSKDDIIHQYDIFPIKIGEGNDAVVYKGKQKTPNGQWRAIKKIHRRYVEKEEYLKSQIEILKKLDHPGVLRIFQVFDDNQYVFIVTQLCEGNSLLQELRRKEGIDESEAKAIFKRIVQIIGYCHKRKIIHRDLKLENLVYSNKDNNAESLRLIDFGMSFNWKTNPRVEIKNTYSSNKVVGTIYYMAPEVYKETYDHRVDIWSAGVILFFLLTGQLPFLQNQDHEIIEAIRERKVPYQKMQQKKCSQEAIDLIKSIFQVEHKRISIQSIQLHPWLQSPFVQSIKQANYSSCDIPFIPKNEYEEQIGLGSENNFDKLCGFGYQNMVKGIEWQRLGQFLKMGLKQKALKIYLSYRLGCVDSDPLIRIFDSLKSATTGRVQIKTLYQELNKKYLYLLQKQQKNLNANQIQKLTIKTQSTKQKTIFSTKQTYKDLLAFFKHNEHHSIGFTIFAALFSDLSYFSQKQFQFIRRLISENNQERIEGNPLEAEIMKINQIIGQMYQKNGNIHKIQSNFQMKIFQGDQAKEKKYERQRQLPKLTLNLQKDPKTNLIIKKPIKKTIKQNILQSISPTFIKRNAPPKQEYKALRTQRPKENQLKDDQQPNSAGYLFGINKILAYF